MSVSFGVGAAPSAVPSIGALNAYWGQAPGPDSHRLRAICDSGVQYATVSFINNSPEHGNGYPGSNFGPNCAADVYTNGGKDTKLLSACHLVQQDIPYCQDKGVKVLLSIGGVADAGSHYGVSSKKNGVEFAEFLYNAFGPYNSKWKGPRPFDSATEHVEIDGFDLDLEDKSPGFSNKPYIAMVDWWRQQSKKLIITAAPECVISRPGGNTNQNDDLIAEAEFDALFIQFYNNKVCDAIPGNADGDQFSYDEFAMNIAKGKSANAKLFIGLPASDSAGSGYINPKAVKDLICEYKDRKSFGGISLWDGTTGLKNKDSTGKSFLESAVELLKMGCDNSPSTATPSTTKKPSDTDSTTPNTMHSSPSKWINGTATQIMNGTVSMTTSTVYTTSVRTVTACPPSITNCPKGKVTTEVVPAYTTVCPVEEKTAKNHRSSSVQTALFSTVAVSQSSSGCSGMDCPGVAVPTNAWTSATHSATLSSPVTAGASNLTIGLIGLIAMISGQILTM